MFKHLPIFAAILLSLTALGILALWIGNHNNGPTYANMSYPSESNYQPPIDTGILIYGNGFYIMADQRIGAPKPTIFIPYWILIAIALIFPAWYFPRYATQHRRGQREANGLCWNCGYDLRMTPDRCPECGSFPRNMNS